MASENDHKCEPEITITAAESNVKSSLIVVSNRLPFVLKKNAGGNMMRQARWVNFPLKENWKSRFEIEVFPSTTARSIAKILLITESLYVDQAAKQFQSPVLIGWIRRK